MRKSIYKLIFTIIVWLFISQLSFSQVAKVESDYTVSVVLPEAVLVDSAFKTLKNNRPPRPKRRKEYFDHFIYIINYSIKVEGNSNKWDYPIEVTATSPSGEKEIFFVNSKQETMNINQLYNFKFHLNSKIKGIARIEVNIPNDFIDEFLDKNIQVTLIGSDVYLN